MRSQEQQDLLEVAKTLYTTSTNGNFTMVWLPHTSSRDYTVEMIA